MIHIQDYDDYYLNYNNSIVINEFPEESDLCKASKAISLENRYQFFKLFSNEELGLLNSLTIFTPLRQEIPIADQNPENLNDLLQKATNNSLANQLIHKSITKLIKDMSECFQKPIQKISLAIHSRRLVDAPFGGWHRDAGTEQDIRAIITLVGDSTKLALSTPEIYKELDAAANHEPYKHIIGNNFESVPKGYGVIFKKGKMGAVHTTPMEKGQRLLAIASLAFNR